MGHIIPEADREVSKAPLSQARKSSIPGVDLEEMSSLKPVVLMSAEDENGDGDYSSQAHLTSMQSADRQPTSFFRRVQAKRNSLAPGGIDLDKPFG